LAWKKADLRQYPLKGTLMNPPSNPTHFADLIKEMEEAPQRSWWEHMTKKWKGMIRL
jgi:cytochrome b pre-mRNA-processing protein 6